MRAFMETSEPPWLRAAALIQAEIALKQLCCCAFLRQAAAIAADDAPMSNRRHYMFAKRAAVAPLHFFTGERMTQEPRVQYGAATMEISPNVFRRPGGVLKLLIYPRRSAERTAHRDK